MHTTVTTTITTRVDLETFEPDHSVDISAEDVLPKQVIMAAVVGGCKATLKTIGDPFAERDDDQDDQDDQDDEGDA